MGEPNFPVVALPHGRWKLVANNESFKVGDHDSSAFSSIPVVILINDIPESADKSWYHGKTWVGIKITATKPSTALLNGTEIANVLKAHLRISKKWYFEKYCSCNLACQFSAL